MDSRHDSHWNCTGSQLLISVSDPPTTLCRREILSTRHFPRFLKQRIQQEPGHDEKDLYQQQGAVEAAECQQRLRQAEGAHPHPPSRQEAQQKRNTALGNEIHQLLAHGPGRAKPPANSSSFTGEQSAALSPTVPPARCGQQNSTQ